MPQYDIHAGESAARLIKALVTASRGRSTRLRRKADRLDRLGRHVKQLDEQRRPALIRADDAVGGRRQRLREAALSTSQTSMSPVRTVFWELSLTAASVYRRCGQYRQQY